MNKRSTLLILAILTAISTSAAASPCGAELCLSDFNAAKMAAACKPEMDDFFSIKRTKHGKFSPSRTYQARRNWLYQCDSGNTAQKEDIMSKFGHIYKPSY
ncbi:hypothetical protein AXE65_04220 [Ventosimonas gracilis]|uniref:TrbM protein n=1 Tax=Ventosimonas gracilis TaxID=1680762 RepID=A0A139SRB1_9GAMM|nr:TrbM/KikA/MpfK family conjugal transfer protein [Ventosimonas gracilis]KXU36991.1 hypothetical protein AXE65_04220 [Ventosimonas gracilis]